MSDTRRRNHRNFRQRESRVAYAVKQNRLFSIRPAATMPRRLKLLCGIQNEPGLAADGAVCSVAAQFGQDIRVAAMVRIITSIAIWLLDKYQRAFGERIVATAKIKEHGARRRRKIFVTAFCGAAVLLGGCARRV